MKRRHVLFLTHRLPYAPNRGDRIRAYHTVRALRDRFRLSVVSLAHDASEAAHVTALRELVDDVFVARTSRVMNYARGAGRLWTSRPLTHSLLDSATIRPALHDIVRATRPDVVLAYSSGMARFALAPPLAGLPVVIDMVDVDSLKWEALGANALFPMRWLYQREARCLSQFEELAAERAFATVVVNARERTALSALAPSARIEIVPCGVDVDYLKPPSSPASGRGVVFCGVMNYRPNEEGAIWLAQKVWPLVRARCGDATLAIVGAQPTSRVRALAKSGSGVMVTGTVPDVRPYLWRAALAAAPLHIARGVQTKVLESVAAGLPTVITRTVAGGLPTDVLRACFIAETPEQFADALVVGLTYTPAERRCLAERAGDLDSLRWPTLLRPLGDLLDDAIRGR